MRPLALLLLALPGTALAGELQFTPDRPGIGDSTGTVGTGHVMIEGGLNGTLVGGSFGLGTGGVIGRVGVADPVEIRVRVPDLALAPSAGVGGGIGVGAKFAATLAEGFGLSIVPELSLSTPGADPGVSVGANFSFGGDPVGGWIHTTVAYANQNVDSILGGGISAPVGKGGLYANAAISPAATSAFMVGGGGWVGFTPAFQMDAGVDVTVFANVVTVVPMIGASGGF